MKTVLLVLFIAAFNFSLFAQESVFSSVLKNESGINPLLSLTEDVKNKNYQAVTFYEKNDAYKVTFTLYDSMMVQKNQIHHVWVKSANDKITFLGSAFFQKKYYSYFSVIKESDLTNELIVIETDSDKLEVKSIEKTEIKSISNTGAYKISFSPSYKTILVMKEPLIEKGKNESVQLTVYDEMLNKITDLSLSFPVPTKPNPVNKAFVSDRGDIYVIKKDREKTDYKFYLYAYNAELKGWNQKIVSIPGKKISDIDASISLSQEFVVAGFYNTLDVSSYEGYFYYRMDASLKYVAKINQRFNADFMANFIGKKAASKDDAVISGYYFENLICAPENQTYILAQIEEYDNASGTEKYTYGNILYLHLDKEGNIRNSGVLNNDQQTQSDEGEWSSFNYAAVVDTLHLFHNEVKSSENKSKFGDASIYGTYHSKLMRGSASTTSPEKEMILKGEDKLSFYPAYVYQTSDNHLIFLLLSKDKMKYALGKMRLK